jgi:hypothetical protein
MYLSVKSEVKDQNIPQNKPNPVKNESRDSTTGSADPLRTSKNKHIKPKPLRFLIPKNLILIIKIHFIIIFKYIHQS